MLPPACLQLGITPDLLAGRPLVLHEEVETLCCVFRADSGREYLLTPEAASAWHAMRDAAAGDGIVLHIVSAHRSIARQTELIQKRLNAGEALADILCLIAPPGFSEHHTGRAVDIGTPGCPPIDEAFADTSAFTWLQAHAGNFGFVLSYPRNNPQGFVYEPWHWCYQP